MQLLTKKTKTNYDARDCRWKPTGGNDEGTLKADVSSGTEKRTLFGLTGVLVANGSAISAVRSKIVCKASSPDVPSVICSINSSMLRYLNLNGEGQVNLKNCHKLLPPINIAT